MSNRKYKYSAKWLTKCFFGQKLSNKSFYRRSGAISAANDAPANDVIYHNICWINAKREADKKYETFFQKHYINAPLDVEVVYFAVRKMTDPSAKVKHMNIIYKNYRIILSSNGKSERLINHHYKKHLKQLIF